MKKLLTTLILTLVSGWSYAYQTIFNPFTGRLDYVGASTSSLSTQAILNQSTLQTGATFYVSSGSVDGQTLLARTSGRVGIGTATPLDTLDIGVSGGKLIFEGQTGVNLYRNSTHVKTDAILDANAFNGNSLSITSVGSFIGGGSAAAGNPALSVNTNAANRANMIIKGLASKTSSYMEVQDNNLVILDMIDLSGNFGIGVSSVTAKFQVVSATMTLFEVKSSTSSVGFHVAISTSGHIVYGGPAPTISACGVTPSGSVLGSDAGGAVTIGGGVVTSCVLTFFSPWGVAPDCTVSDNSTSVNPSVTSISSTAMTIGLSATLGGGIVYYHCQCDQGSSCL